MCVCGVCPCLCALSEAGDAPSLTEALSSTARGDEVQLHLTRSLSPLAVCFCAG